MLSRSSEKPGSARWILQLETEMRDGFISSFIILLKLELIRSGNLSLFVHLKYCGINSLLVKIACVYRL